MSLQALTKECQNLWESNKDMQGRFVNDLSELQRLQLAISQLEQTQRHDQLRHAQQSMHVRMISNVSLPSNLRRCSNGRVTSTSN